MKNNKKLNMHILGYFPDDFNDNTQEYKELNSFLDEMKERRTNKIRIYIKWLNDHNFNVTYEEVEKISQRKSIGKPHLAQLLYQKDYVKSYRDAFDYLEVDELNNVSAQCKISPEIAIEKY